MKYLKAFVVSNDFPPGKLCILCKPFPTPTQDKTNLIQNPPSQYFAKFLL